MRPQCVGTASAVPPAARIAAAVASHASAFRLAIDDRGAARGVGLGDGAADAATPAGDDRDATVEVELGLDLASDCASVQSRR